MKKTEVHQSGLHIFNLFDFEVRLDWSWIFLAILVTWTLAAGYFPAYFPNLNISTYWIMGAIGAIGLFLSIIFHELCHSLVGRHYGMSFTGITLFIFGGVAKMSNAPPNPKTELLMSIAGPLFSLFIGVLFYYLFLIGIYYNWPTPINGVLNYLGVINIILGIFNLLPGFPLDGGRVFRSILWWWKGDLKWATRVACTGGIGLSFGMIFFGIYLMIQTAFISGMWMFLLGLFLLYLSKMSYQDVIINECIRGESIKKYVKTNPVTVKSNITLQELVDNYFYKYYHKLYPVVDNGRLVGGVSLNEIRKVPKEQWPKVYVEQIMFNYSEEIAIDAETEMIKVLEMMRAQNISRLMVTDNGKLYGVISLKDLTDVIFIKLSLNDGDM